MIRLTKIPLQLLFLLLLLTATATLTKAQQFGGNPPSIKWKQIDLPAAKVIFPEGLDSAGLLVANIVRQMNRSIQPTIGFKQRQISILLQNQTTIANAYVGLAPFRSEFFLTAEQNSFEIGSLSWPEQLAIHEFRHVQQYNNFNVGFSHVMKVFFGEGGQALANDIAIPNWFFEGDAVFNETHVSGQGRGRLPYFFNGYRALWAAGKDYSWMKLRNGSYRDFVPDWYPTGYMLVSYGREKYGDDFWKKVTQDAAAYTGVFYPLDKAVKKYSGVDFKTFRNEGLDYFRKQFSDDRVADVRFEVPKHFDADREYPAYINDSTMIYMKSTYNHIPVFVVKTGTREREIAVRSVSLDNYFAYQDGKIVYAAYRPDLRWNYRDYSELMLLDVNTGKEHRITKNTKYFAPDFSPDGKTIVTVKEGTNGKCDLYLINTETGRLISIVPNKENLFYTYPKFYGKDYLIAAIRTPKGKMSLDLIDVKTGSNTYLLPFSYQPIAFPLVQNDTVYFSATSGIDDRLFALSLKTLKLFELTTRIPNRSVGNYEPAVSDNKFAWVGLSAFGYHLNEKNKQDLQWTAVNTEIPGGLPDFGISALKRDSST
ncbi:MAG: TolB family protein, partial [Sphingobacteriales bacterium]